MLETNFTKPKSTSRTLFKYILILGFVTLAILGYFLTGENELEDTFEGRQLTDWDNLKAQRLLLVFAMQKGRFTVVNGGGIEERNGQIVKMVYDAFVNIEDKLDGKEKIFGIETSDSPIPFYKGFKVYSCTGTRNNLANLAPDYIMEGWAAAFMPYFNSYTQDIRRVFASPPLVDKLFWIGSEEGRYTKVRSKFLQIARQHPDLIEARTIDWVGDWKPGSDVTQRRPKQWVTLLDHANYSMLIDIEGTGYSGRLKFMLHMNRTLFIQERNWWDWSIRGLKAWEHYIPIRNDFTDLLDQIKWAKSHPVEAAKITANRLAYAAEFVTRQAAVKRYEEIILNS